MGLLHGKRFENGVVVLGISVDKLVDDGLVLEGNLSNNKHQCIRISTGHGIKGDLGSVLHTEFFCYLFSFHSFIILLHSIDLCTYF